MSTSKDLDNAVKAAKAAFPKWSHTPIKERVQVFYKYKYLMEQNLQELAALVSEENGKQLAKQRQKLKNVLNLLSLPVHYHN
jgi:malonate-semialdehyde dehydrogenase (acetylating)/methylmalonate-semialdehyde dehydrogenase